MRIAKLALVVRDYDEAIAWFTRCLGFELAEDVDMDKGKRWVVVEPPGKRGASLLLAKASGAQQEAAIGNQSGGGFSFFLRQTTSIATTRAWCAKASISAKRRAASLMARSRCLKTLAATHGT
jgi:catechol 2,3-dioxygenase-like lactoylglutathione lyase family enzyme